MAILLTGVSVPDATDQAQVAAPSADKPALPEISSESIFPLPAPENEMDTESSMVELLRLLSNEEELDIVPALSGYLITNDSTFLPEEGDARIIARRIGRDRMLAMLIEAFAASHSVPNCRRETCLQKDAE